MNPKTPELHLERLTWPQVRGALDAGMTTVVFACGATEQHGPHLPLLVDAEIGTRLAAEVARRLGNALVAPTVRVGCSEHHMSFPGTLTLRPATFEAVVTDYCTSLARHGFREVFIIPSHGGNFQPLATMLPRLRDAVGKGVSVRAYTDVVDLLTLWKRVVEGVGGPAERVGGHADIAESSILLNVTPELVQESLAEAGYVSEISRADLERILRDGLHTVTPNGILGDARGMDRTLGARLIEAMVERLVEVLRAPD